MKPDWATANPIVASASALRAGVLAKPAAPAAIREDISMEARVIGAILLERGEAVGPYVITCDWSEISSKTRDS